MKSHFQNFARYNQWANQRLYAAAESLSEDKLWRDMGAYFGSLMGTLNHIVVGDTLWLNRLTEKPVPILRLDEVLYRHLPAMRQARETLDAQFIEAIDACPDERLGSLFAYTSTTGERCEQRLDAVLTHVFNHQTHHRGQAHGLLSQLGGEAPPLDFIYFVRFSAPRG